MIKLLASLMIATALFSSGAFAREVSDAMMEDGHRESASSVNRNAMCPSFDDRSICGPKA